MKGRYYLWIAATATAYLLGIGTGILVSKNRMEQKYRRIAKEEIDSVKKTFSKMTEKRKSTAVPKAEEPTEENRGSSYSEKTRVVDILRQTGYAGKDPARPYIISPDNFGEMPDYEQISLTYFSDGVLTDENYYSLDEEDAADMVGEDYSEHFGEYEEDSVFVRNEARKTDFEILLDQRRYSDVLRTMPPQ